jgi:hypothetical protein
MADESLEQSRRSGQPAVEDGKDEASGASNRRRVIIASLLAPPAVMTLGARSARAQASNTPSMVTGYGRAAKPG